VARNIGHDQQLTQSRYEEPPPWDPRSEFSKLELGHRELKARLPCHLNLTIPNTYAFIDNKTTSPRDYFSIHALHFMCTAALHRQYMPFAPWGQSFPVGPLDHSIIETPTNNDYWKKQAHAYFSAAEDFASLLKSFRSAGVLVHNIVGWWATYNVGFSGEFAGRSSSILR
jgi:hypothetical protein